MSTLRGVTNIGALQSLASPADGDVAVLEGYYDSGDGGGGEFYFEGTALPNSATIVAATTSSATVTGASNAAPIVITTAAAHGLVTGQSVLVENVLGNTAANGSWIVTVVDSTHFSLNDSIGNGNWSSGGTQSASTITVQTAAANSVSIGARIVIGGVTWNSGGGINGTWSTVGVVNTTTFSVPARSTGTYTSGGILADGGMSILSTAVSGRWLRLNGVAANTGTSSWPTAKRVSVRWFGAVGDGTGDDHPAFAAAIAALAPLQGTTFGSTGFNPGNGRIDVPAGLYRMTKALHLNRFVHLVGTGAMSGSNDCYLNFDINVSGIVVHYAGSSWGGRADGTIIEKLIVACHNNGSTSGDGIVCEGRTSIRDVLVYGFARDGIHIVANSGGTPATNANLTSVEHCQMYFNGRYGLYTQANDANACVIYACDASNNGEWGFYENSFLGNTYIACHASYNGVNPTPASGVVQAIAKAQLSDGKTFTISDGVHTAKVFEFDITGNGVGGGNVAVDIHSLTTAAQVGQAITDAINGAHGAGFQITAGLRQSPAGWVDITNDNIGPVGNIAITETVSDTNFAVTGMQNGANGLGGAYFSSSSNTNCSEFFGCYSEGSQFKSDFGAALVFGGTHGAPIENGATVHRSGGSHVSLVHDDAVPTLHLHPQVGMTLPHLRVTGGDPLTTSPEILRFDNTGRLWIGYIDSANGGPDYSIAGTAYKAGLRIAGNASGSTSGLQFLGSQEWIASFRPYWDINYYDRVRVTLQMPGDDQANETDVMSWLPQNVGIGTTAPDTSSLLDLSSTTKGLLPPRMTNTQRDAIQPATGTIQAVAKASLVDGETFTLNDGTNTPTVFEFDVSGSGVAGGHVAVDVHNDTTAADVGARMITAINSVGSGLTITARRFSPAGLVTLVNDVGGSAGDQAITDTVANAGFTHTGMSGSAPADGLVVYNTSTHALNVYENGAWVELGSSAPRLHFSEAGLADANRSDVQFFGQSYTIGTSFYATKPSMKLTGMRFFWGSSGSKTVKCALWDVNTNLVTSVNLAVIGIGVKEATFASPVTLDMAQYRLSTWVNDGSGYYYLTVTTATARMPLSSYNSVIFGEGYFRYQACYCTGGGDAFPNGNDATTLMTIDPVFV